MPRSSGPSWGGGPSAPSLLLVGLPGGSLSPKQLWAECFVAVREKGRPGIASCGRVHPSSGRAGSGLGGPRGGRGGGVQLGCVPSCGGGTSLVLCSRSGGLCCPRALGGLGPCGVELRPVSSGHWLLLGQRKPSSLRAASGAGPAGCPAPSPSAQALGPLPPCTLVASATGQWTHLPACPGY